MAIDLSKVTSVVTRPVGNDGGPVPVQLSGSNGEQDIRGLAAARPAADSVIIGSTYWSVDTGVVEVSDGTAWRRV